MASHFRAGILSLPAWGVWIEIKLNQEDSGKMMSLPAWGVWIEIKQREKTFEYLDVAPRMGSVD